MVRPAISVTVFDQSDLLGVLCEDGEIGGKGFPEKRVTVADGAEGQVPQEPVRLHRDVEDGGPVAVRLRHEDAATFIDTDGDGILQPGLRREKVDLEARRDGKFLDRAFGGFGGDRG